MSEPIYLSDRVPSHRHVTHSNPFRAVSITASMQNLSLASETVAGGTDILPSVPSYIPKAVPIPPTPFPSPTSSPSKRPSCPPKSAEKHQFLNKYTNTRAAWDTTNRLEEMEQNMKHLYGLNEKMEQSMTDRNTLQEQVNLQKTRST